VTIARNTACVAALALALSAPASFAEQAPAVDCGTEASALSKQQSELPRLDVASPADRPPYCITLETVMAFALRVKAPPPPSAFLSTSRIARARTTPPRSRTGSRHRRTIPSCFAGTDAKGRCSPRIIQSRGTSPGRPTVATEAAELISCLRAGPESRNGVSTVCRRMR